MKRMIPKERAKMILEAALELAETRGYRFIKREDVAKSVDCTPALITFYFKSMTILKSQVVELAVKKRNHKVLCQAISCGDSAVKNLSKRQKVIILKSVFG